MHHILYECALSPPIPWECLLWKKRPSAWSDALLCDPSYDKDLMKRWRTMCKRAVSLLSRGRDGEREMGSSWDDNDDCDASNVPKDLRGHEICLTPCGSHAYCAKCHIARCFRDAKYIAVKRCMREHHEIVREGQKATMGGHDATLSIVAWKTGSKRPQFHCNKCEHRWWATI